MAKLKYDTITDDDEKLDLADQLHYREIEHQQYDRNADGFKALLDAMAPLNLPAEWPDELKQYRKMTRDQVIEAIEDEATEELVLNLLHRKQLRERWRAERHEAKRVEQYIEQIKAQLPKQKAAYDKVLLDAKTRRQARGQ